MILFWSRKSCTVNSCFVHTYFPVYFELAYCITDCFILFPPFYLTTFVAAMDTLPVSAHFKLVETPFSNFTRMTIPPRMILTPLLSFTTYICTIYKPLVLMTFICRIDIIAILNCLHSHFFLQYLHLLKLSEASDSYQWYDCPNLHWLSLISLFRRTKSCCMTFMPTLETVPTIT